MSDDEADEIGAAAADAYAAEFDEDDYDNTGSSNKKQKTVYAKPANPAWCLIVQLKFSGMSKVMAFQKLFAPYAEYVREHEPSTLSYSLIASDKSPLTMTVVERYTDKETAYLKVHKGSEEFAKFRPALDALNPVVDGHSYYEDAGFMAR